MDTPDNTPEPTPDRLISLTTVLYVGFTPSVAMGIWERWSAEYGHTEGIDDEEIFFSFLTAPAAPADAVSVAAHITAAASSAAEFAALPAAVAEVLTEDEAEDDADWFAVMTRCGVSSEIQTALMNPYFKYRRRRNTCGHWLRELIRVRFKWRKRKISRLTRGTRHFVFVIEDGMGYSMEV